jgi:hypothetical protein
MEVVACDNEYLRTGFTERRELVLKNSDERLKDMDIEYHLHNSRGNWPNFCLLYFTTASRTALGPIQPPIQWVPGALSLGVKRP